MPSVPSRRPPPNFMKYPYPDTECILTYLETLSTVKEETKRCIHNLLNYRAVRTRARFPRGPSAAVLVPLFVGRSGDLYVLLSRRSDTLKTFAGDTAFPGGKIDAEDVTVEDTARREAFEEIGLPRDKERTPLLCVMEPQLAKGEIMVTPVVVLILDHGLQPILNPSEVTSIFAQPLISFLSSTPHLSAGRTADPDDPYHSFIDIPWSDGGTLRLHKFLTGRESEGVKPVFGFTASILIKTATIAYGRIPDFEVQPPDAPTPAQQIAHALLTPANPIRIACEREGIDANSAAARVLRPPLAANAARMTEWGKIGREWKKLMEEEGLGTKMQESKKERAEVSNEESKARGEERWDAISDLETLGAYLDKTRDMVNERMKEVKGDERKLAKARKAYPRILERVKKQLDAARDENGEFDPEALFALIPKDSQDGFRRGVKAAKEGTKREKEVNDDKDGVEQGKEGMRRDLEEMKYVGKGGDGHNNEQIIPPKRDAKL